MYKIEELKTITDEDIIYKILVSWKVNEKIELDGYYEYNEELSLYFFGYSLSDNDGDIIRQIYKCSEKSIIFYLKK